MAKRKAEDKEDADDEEDKEADESTEPTRLDPAEFPSCRILSLPGHRSAEAADAAREENPVNAPLLAHPGFTESPPAPLYIAMTQRYWGPKGAKKVGVLFLDTPQAALKRKILSYMNRWSRYALANFVESRSADSLCRIARTPGQGYSSYVGTDNRLIPRGQPTMYLDSFSLSTPDSEYLRVVPHETGHWLGCPHEHQRRAEIARLDRQKTYALFLELYGWPQQMVDAQVFTPLDERSLMATPPDETSVMCYHFPGSITLDGRPILGGTDVNATDGAFMGKVYPK